MAIVSDFLGSKLVTQLNYGIDDLAIYLSEDSLKVMTFDLLKLIREVLINLSLTVNVEEINKKPIEEEGLFKVSFIKYEDEWKL